MRRNSPQEVVTFDFSRTRSTLRALAARAVPVLAEMTESKLASLAVAFCKNPLKVFVQALHFPESQQGETKMSPLDVSLIGFSIALIVLGVVPTSTLF